MNQLIAAIATPPGTGAVGMVRLSGPGAIDLADGIFTPAGGHALRDLPGYRGALGRITDSGRTLDEAIAFLYRAPRSYTGEDCVELSLHGGSYIVKEVLALCICRGARPADPGEFTRRAFLNGKLNLSQAEAVCDLINAESEGARKAALAARDGALSTEITKLVESLTALSAHLAAWSDYPEEDLEPVDPADLTQKLEHCLTRIDALLSTYDRGRLIRQGIATAIVGKPNVGKSTLMNLLSGARRSIVTDMPGTTRDVVEESVRVGDYLLRLMDTAGLRQTDDPVEQQGVTLARERLQSAGLVLAVFDSSLPLEQEDLDLLQTLQTTPAIAVINKADLEQRLDTDLICKNMETTVTLSAATGEGREALEAAIAKVLQLDQLDPTAAIVMNERQRSCLQGARTPLEEATAALTAGVTLDAVGVCIDDALEQLLTLTGERATQRVVDQVFARFCVGK